MKQFTTLALLWAITTTLVAQKSAPLWTEADRQYLLTNLERTKQEIIQETQDLTPEQ